MKKIIAILLCIPSLAMAEFYTGNQLLTKMRSTSTVDKAIALGYVMGVADAHQDLAYCPPENVSAGQVHDMVKQALEVIPNIRNESADIIVQAVLSAEWPCKNNPKPRSAI
jgi:hypothetical protein